MIVLGTQRSLDLSFDGVLDGAAVARHRKELESLEELRGDRELVVRLDRVARIDPSGVALIVSLLCGARERGVRARIMGLRGQPARVFELLRVPLAA